MEQVKGVLIVYSLCLCFSFQITTIYVKRATWVCWTNISILTIFVSVLRPIWLWQWMHSAHKMKGNRTHIVIQLSSSIHYYYYLLFGLVNLICNLYVCNGNGLTSPNVLRFTFHIPKDSFWVQPLWKYPFIIYHFVLLSLIIFVFHHLCVNWNFWTNFKSISNIKSWLAFCLTFSMFNGFEMVLSNSNYGQTKWYIWKTNNNNNNLRASLYESTHMP